MTNKATSTAKLAELDPEDGFSTVEPEDTSSGESIRSTESEWSIPEEWFATKPEVKKGTVDPASLAYFVGKKLDVRKGFKVWVDGSPQRTKISSNSGSSETFVVYNYEKGTLHFPDDAGGKEFTLEFYEKGKKGKHSKLDSSEEYAAVQSIKSRAASLWSGILNHPDPEFVIETLIPTIEDELEHLREDDDSIPDLTDEFMTLEQLLHRISSDGKSLSKNAIPLELNDTFVEESELNIPPGSTITGVIMEGEKMTRTDDDPQSGEYVLEDGVLLFSEEDLAQQVIIEFTQPSNAQGLVSQLIKENIAPKLTELHSLASLLSEQIYDLQSESDQEDLEGLPGAESASVVDPEFLDYAQSVQSKSKKMDEEITDLSRFYMPKLAKIIQAGSTYFPSKGKKDTSRDEKWFRSSVKPIFDRANVGISDLLNIAMDSLRDSILEFDYDKRDKAKIPNASDFRVVSNPKVWMSVASSLKKYFEQLREEESQVLERASTQEIKIPMGGGVVDIDKGVKASSIRVVLKETGKEFTQGGGLSFVAGPGQGNSSRISLVGPTASGEPSPFANRNFASPSSRSGTPTGAKVTDSQGNEFTRVSSTAEVKKSSGKVFYLTTSNNRGIVLPKKYEGETFTVVITGTGASSSDDTSLSSGTFRVLPKGKIEFSPEDGGKVVEISSTVRTRTNRRVAPTSSSDEGEELSIQDMVEDEDASVESQLADRILEDNASKLIDIISSVLSDPDENRLSDKEKVLLSGLLGIGSHNGERKSIREIAQEEPFNIDVDTKSGETQVSRLRNTVQPAASSKLVSILQDKLSSDPALQQLMKSRSFTKVLFNNSPVVDKDKVVSYLENKNREGTNDYSKRLRNFVGLVLPRANLKEDEENILRWRWGIQGPLRRTSEDSDKQTSVSKSTTTPLDLIVAEEFLSPEELEDSEEAKNRVRELMPFVEKVYQRALDKLQPVLDALLQKNEAALMQSEWGQDFLKFYKNKRSDETVRDLLVEEEGGPEAARTNLTPKESPKAESLFDQIDNTTGNKNSDLLRSLLKELDEEQKKGRDLASMIKQREESSLQDKDKQSSYEDMVESYMESRRQLNSFNDEYDELRDTAKELLRQMRDEASPETRKELAALLSKTKGTNGDALKSVLDQIRGKSGTEAGSEFTKTRLEMSVLKQDIKELASLVSKRRSELQKKKRQIPAIQAKNELPVLNDIQKFFTHNDEYSLGGGKYNLNLLFDTKPKKREKYIPPKVETDEDAPQYSPQPRPIPNPPKVVKKPQPEPRPFQLNIKTPTPQDKGEENEERVRRPISQRGRTLYDQLLSYALPPDPQQSAKDRVKEVAKFRDLLDRMRAFTTGENPEGTVSEFLKDPKSSKNEALMDERTALDKIKEFLTKNASDLQTSEGNWDMSQLYKPREVVEKKAPDMDVTPETKSPESLQDTQDLGESHAALVHSFIRLLEKGVSPSKIFSGIKRSKSLEADTASKLAGRLLLYLKLHPERRSNGKYDFTPLYTGEDKFPSEESFMKTRPLLSQLGPFFDSLVRESKESGTPESTQQVRSKVEDLLSRMEELIDEDFDLSEIADHFEELDSANEKDYSLSYLFQRVRNYLSRLNRTVGLSNMVKNYGTDKVFPEGASLSDPSDAAETTPVPSPTQMEEKKEEAQEQGSDPDQRTPSFTTMVEEQSMSSSEAQMALQILESTQLRMEDSGSNAAEVLGPLMKRERLAPVVKKILRYFSSHMEELRSDFPGIPDLSSLTGLPFSPPDVSDMEQEEQEVREEATATQDEATATQEETPSVPVEKAPKKAPKKAPTSKRGRLPKELTSLEVSPEQRALFLDGLRQRLTLENLGVLDVSRYKDLKGFSSSVKTKMSSLSKKEKSSLKKSWSAFTARWRDYLRSLDSTSSNDNTSPEPVENTETKVTLPGGPAIGKEQLTNAFKSLGRPQMALVQQGLSSLSDKVDFPKQVTNLSLRDWAELTKMSTGETQQAFLALVRVLAPAKPAADSPSAPAAPAQPTAPAVDVDKLRDKAVEVSIKQGWKSGQEFEDYLKKNRADLHQVYVSIRPAVDAALAQHYKESLNIDLSDVFK